MEVQGQFNVTLFYETLAKIISQREGVNVTVKVTKKDEGNKTA